MYEKISYFDTFVFLRRIFNEKEDIQVSDHLSGEDDKESTYIYFSIKSDNLRFLLKQFSHEFFSLWPNYSEAQFQFFKNNKEKKI